MTSNFSAFGVPDRIVSTLSAQGLTEAFPIQADTLRDTLAGRDVLGRGKTGSGKTLAFSIPLVARLAGDLAGGKRRPGRPTGLVLAPTRELATQIAAVIEPLATPYGLTVTTIFGGVSQNRQVAALKAGVDIVVACPGRLEDLMKQRFLTLDAVEITVIDEADHMADLGFLPGVTRILAATPENGQRMLFSATLDNGVDKLVRRFLHNEVLHSVDEANSPVSAMTHHVLEVDGADAKRDLVRMLASGTERRVLFLRTKHAAKKLAKQLTESGIPAVDLHGNLSQAARDRNLAEFGSGEVRVLVATDVAARGVHVDDVDLVVHVDPPTEHKAYLHRSGRTARAGKAGSVVTVVLPEQRRDVRDLLRKAAIDVQPVAASAATDTIADLVGVVAPHVRPTVRPVQVQGPGRSTGANAERKRARRSGSGTGGTATHPSSGGGERQPRAGRTESGRPTTGMVVRGSGGGGQRRGRGGR
ncbi:DEAD/DEAH box helicase [Naasia aerilata]|uniref:ATP-dependent RNA helicase n=1 Tax=Naasia aerilata TaxID=1162966 RepID=A0ABN6XN85_9MICO|nr:DEAD/DEAH box helicase [Naasia aerilata]BDZ45136.1 putative ATP-dependent RNA helicase [Naasia aerilata]